MMKRTNLAELKSVLDQGVIKSERVKLEIIDKVLDGDFKTLAARKGSLADADVNRLIQKVLAYSPDASRFRDDYLEKIAWKLQLNEKQLTVFIEPMKSFNFKTLDQNTLNLMSVFSSLSKRMKENERLELVKYIQHPESSIEKSIPRINDLMLEASQHMNGGEDFYVRMRDNFESMIRDAGDNEKLMLIENLVGTRETGLWFSNTAREKLYELSSLTGIKRKLLETYLKALPEYEHSIVMSYLLSTATNTSDSDLLRIMEMFQTPGLKFAQMASIFSLFGEEESKKLATAKSKAKPPTRANIFELLKERLPESEYKKIKSVDRLLGSGSIKYVVSVTLEDGTKRAVYLRRPFIEETISTTLDIVDKWLVYLKKDPEFKNSIDYDYYLSSLREQLEEEIKFAQEAEYTNIMADRYEKVDEYKGWKFKGVRAIEDVANSKDIYYYNLVENGVGFDDLSPSERKVVSEYIVSTEIDNIFSEGDADRHLGNFLFDRKKKIIYPLDMGQYYRLKKTSLFKTGQTYEVAKMLYGLSHKDKKEGAKILVEVFEKLKTSGEITDSARNKLIKDIQSILMSDKSQMDKVLGILGNLNKSKIRLPFEISLGVIKGMSIVFNEDYAKVVGEKFVEDEVKEFVTEEMMIGKPVSVVEDIAKSVKDWFSSANLDCNVLFKSK